MIRAAILALFLIACGSDKSSPSPAPAASLTQPKSSTPTLITAKTRQLVTAVVDDFTTTKATLRLWERNPAGAWQAKGDPWSAVIGRNGTAWGIGVHGAGAPNREGPLKKEGDGKSPAGVFAIRGVYGVADDPPKGAKLPYETTAKGDWQCVDDPGSDHYAEIVDRKQVAADWTSNEELLRDDALYTWVVDIAHNPEHARSKGSCIFLHVWGGPETTTSGCTAMEEPKLAALIATLDPAANPLYVLLPRADYAALAPAWGLPPL